MRRLRKYLLRLLIGIVVTILVALAAARTSWVRSLVKDTIESAVTEAINGSLTIERLGGSLFGDVSLEGVVLRVEGDTLGRIAHLRVRFGVFGLLSSKATIEELTLQGVDVRITKNAEGEWVTSRIAKRPAEPSQKPVPAGPFPWVIRAERIRLADGRVAVGSDSTAMVIQDLALSGSLVYSESEKNVGLDSLRFTSTNPELTLRHLSAEASLEQGAFVLHRAEIRTDRNSVSLAGRHGAPGPSEVEFSTTPLDLSELPGIPARLNAALRPTVRGNARMFADSLQFSLTIARSTERIDLSGRIEGLAAQQHSTVDAVLSRVDLAAWFPGDLPSSDLNGRVGFGSIGLDPEVMRGEVKVSLGPSRVLDTRLDRLEASATATRGAVEAALDIKSEFGSGRIEASVDDVLSLSSYEVKLRAEHVDLAVPLNTSGLESDLTVDAHIRGRSLDPSKGTADFEAFVHGVAPKGFALDSCALSGTLSDGQFQVERLRFVSPEISGSISGRIGLDGRLEGEGMLELVDPSRLLRLAGFDPAVSGSGPLHVTAGGSTDSLDGELRFSLGNVLVSPVRADTLWGTVGISLRDGVIEARGLTEAGGFEVAGVKAQSVRLDGSYGALRLEGETAIGITEDLTVRLRARARFEDTVVVEMPSLSVDLGGGVWTNAQGPVTLRVSGGRVMLENFRMRSGEQAVMADGTFAPEDSIDIMVAIDTTEVEPFFRAAHVPVSVSGRANLRLTATGHAADPRIAAELRGQNVVIGSQSSGAITLGATSASGRLGWDLSLLDAVGNEVKSSGYVPVAVTAQGVSVNRDSTLFARFETQGYNLAWIRSLRHELEHVAGSLSAKIELSGRLAEPAISGTFTVTGGELRAPSLGLDIKDLALAGGGHGPRLWLDSLGASVGGGRLRATGEAQLAFGDSLGLLDSLALVVTGDGLSAVVPRRFEVRADAGLRAVYGGRELNYGGQITVPESRIFLPGLAAKFSPSRRSLGRPMLLQATVPFDSALGARTDTARGSKGLPVMGDRTRGRVAVSFPKNTWIQSPNINVELYGDLVAIQTDTLLELEGTLRISRGTVQIVGKRFLVRTGRAEFSRGPTINPAFTVELDYRFRDINQQERSLTARLSGTAEAPVITFALEEKLLTQQDAISYLLFGRSVDELTLNQQSSVSSGDDNMAASMAFDMLGAQLSNVIAQRAGLDVVEIKSTGGAKAGTLTAGKYIAEGVFISYEKGFGEYGADETIPEVFTVEYELLRSFFVQLVQANDPRSGLDLIYKIR